MFPVAHFRARYPRTPMTHPDTRQPNGRFGAGNPGRPPGARARQSQRLIMAILQDFGEHQDEILRRLREHHLPAYVALASRLRGMPGASVAFLVFDILYRDGRPLLNQPLERRRQLLRKVLRPGDQAIAVPSLAGEGRALFAAVTEVGIAGVMARLGRSPYLPGVRSRMWRFVPCRNGSIGPTAGVPDVPVASAEQQDNSRPSAPVLALIRRLPMGDMEA